MYRRSLLGMLAALPCLAASPLYAASNAYPSKPVTIVVPYGAGGAADALIRPIAEALGTEWKQPVVVDNRPGANGMIATQLVSKASPDGYTLLLNLTGIVQNLSLYKKVSYDPFKDLQAITQIGTQPMGLAVAPRSPARTVPALLEMAKATPADFSYGSFGTGSTGHIYGELLRSTAQLQIPHLPYKGEAPMLPDLISGRIQFGFVSASTAATRYRDKSLRILAVTGPRRLAGMPDVPTLAEVGYKGFEAIGWYGLFAPAGTPRAVIEKVSADVASVLKRQDIQTRMRDLAVDPTGTSPEAFSQVMRNDYTKWDGLIKTFRIELE
ncbi:tripartite tricarboxylate transporter substrate binding protein [Cupriavidus sp. 2SB]|uniref:Bug family tripartite tricarboxylate transporter substrate binding protein n=1 Tax=Cupriavidus sp. 2SB TaxID=2502199 RepID=UPI0010F8BCE3|nr:tripartite tricarboxylate transporter substrate binding protein [Cupriavidus sp. 2SB]